MSGANPGTPIELQETGPKNPCINFQLRLLSRINLASLFQMTPSLKKVALYIEALSPPNVKEGG